MSKLSTNDSRAVQKRHECPKCGNKYVNRPALSRQDATIKIVQSVVSKKHWRYLPLWSVRIFLCLC